MAATLSPGTRKWLGDVDRAVFGDLHRRRPLDVQSEDFAPAFLHTNTHAGDHGGFVLLASNVTDALQMGSPVGLANEDLAIRDPGASDFSWQTLGDVAIADGVATISEDVGMISDLSQTFVIPNGVNTITFTLGGLNLDVGGGGHPVEAFEVSLLGAGTTTSLLGEMVGLGGGDGLLSIQAGGEVYFADTVQVAGVGASGDSVDLSAGSINVTVPVPASAAGTTATLYFDLIGFGDDASSATVSNIDLTTEKTWQNPVDRHDVNDLDGVSAIDALLIINELRRVTVHDPQDDSKLFPITDEVGPPPYYDVTGDGRITALDALQVINRMTRDNNGNAAPEWTNPSLRFDVDGLGDVTALDALIVINELATARVYDPVTGQLPAITNEVHPTPFYDVTGDGKLSALDALQIINEVARQTNVEPESYDQALMSLLGPEGRKDA